MTRSAASQNSLFVEIIIVFYFIIQFSRYFVLPEPQSSDRDQGKCYSPYIINEGVEIQCHSKENGSHIMSFNNCSIPQPVGAVLSFYCKNGFHSRIRRDGWSENQLTCIYDGSWFGYESIADFHCFPNKFEKMTNTTPVSIHCDAMTPNEGVQTDKFLCKSGDLNSEWKNCTNLYTPGLKIKYECENNFIREPVELSNSQNTPENELTCGEDGEWIGKDNFLNLRCKKIECSPLIIYGKRGVEVNCTQRDKGVGIQTNNCSEPQPINTKAEYQCKKFYVPKITSKERDGGGPNTLVCNGKGIWTGLAQLEEFECKPDCGKRIVDSKPLITHGSQTNSTSWPWHAAIFRRHKETTPFIYICGGSLILESVIITAAHCVTNLGGEQVSPKLFKISLGTISSNFSLNTGNDIQTFGVKRIFVHRSYNVRTVQADIAIMELDKDVELNDFICPICLPDSSSMDVFALEPGKKGDVVGFGADETGKVPGDLRHIKIQIGSFEDCFKNLNQILLDSQICAGNKRLGQYVCNGDSGGGLIVPNEINSAYYLHGIVSSGDPNDRGQPCSNYGVFTRVYKFIDWISEELSQITGEINQEKQSSFTFAINGSENNYVQFRGIPPHIKVTNLHIQYMLIEPEILIRTLENSRGVETINLDSIELQSTVFNRRVRLPHLKSFKMNIFDREKKISYLVAKGFLKSLLFFDLDEDWDLEMILHLNINIELTVGVHHIIKINHQEGEIIWGHPPSTGDIFNHFPTNFRLKKLSVNGIGPVSIHSYKIPNDLIYLKLQTVTINSGNDSYSGLEDIFQRCTHLEVVLIEAPDLSPPVDISTLLSNAVKLKRILFYNFPIFMSNPMRKSTSLETLALSSHTPSNVQENFNQIFPSLKELVLLEDWDYVTLLTNALNSHPSLKQIFLLKFTHPKYLDNSASGNALLNILKIFEIPEKEGPLFFVLQRSENGVWKLHEELSLLQGVLLGVKLVDIDKFYTSNEDLIGKTRLSPEENRVFQDPQNYKLTGTSLENPARFQPIPQVLQFKLRTIEINFANVSPEHLLKSMERISSYANASGPCELESLILNRVYLGGAFDYQVFAPFLTYFYFDRRSDISIETYRDSKSGLSSLIPFTTKKEWKWKSTEITQLNFIIDLRINTVQLFRMNPNTGLFYSTLKYSEEILKNHQKASEDFDSSDKHNFVIKHLHLDSCSLEGDLPLKNLTTISLSNVSLTELSVSKFIQNSLQIESLSLVNCFTRLDLIDLPASIKNLRIHGFKTVMNSAEPGIYFRNFSFDKFILEFCDEIEDKIIENFFQIFPSNWYFLNLLKNQDKIVENAIQEVPPWVEIKIIIPLKFSKQNQNNYSDTLMNFFKIQDLIRYSDKEYGVLLQKGKNEPWSGQLYHPDKDWTPSAVKVWGLLPTYLPIFSQ